MPDTERSGGYYPRGGRHTIKRKRSAADSLEFAIQDMVKGKDRSPQRSTNGNGAYAGPRSNMRDTEPIPIDSINSGPLTIMVADDHAIVREGMAALISRCSDMKVIAEASNGRQAVEKYAEHRPSIGLLDLRMPVMDGIEAVSAIVEKDPSARLAVVTSYQCEEDVYRALRAGAKGYVLKDSSVDELIDCVRAVAHGDTWIPSQVGAKLARRLAHEPLTARETEVLRAVTAGKSNKEIGAAFNISEATVKVHMTHILEKLNVTGRTEAINVGLKRGLVYVEGVLAA